LEEFIHLYEEEKGVLFDIYQFGSGEELLEELHKRGMILDLLFLDNSMKKLTGLETAQLIRQSDSMSACGIVFVTADVHDQFMQVQPLQVVGKPVTRECIDTVLDKVLVKKT